MREWETASWRILFSISRHIDPVKSLREYIRSYSDRPMVRPLALAGPVLVLLISLPLLRPLRHPSEISNDELLRLATIRALVEHRTLAIDPALPSTAAHAVVTRDENAYSAQPPMMAVLLAIPAWVMVRLGLSFDDNLLLISYLLTVLGVTLPVAAAAGLIYRMSRLFELKRYWRAGLSIAVVLASGLISYAVVLNAYAPTAALVLASAACLIHVAALERAGTRWIWMLLSGACAGLSAALEPSASVLALLFMFVIAAMRFSIGLRAAGVGLYLLGALPALLIHAQWNRSITGDWLAASVHDSFVQDRAAPPTLARPDDEEEAQYRSYWIILLRPLDWLTRALIGSHGLLSHFPVMIIGVAGVFAVMHRHWPTSTKTLAAATLIGAITIVLGYCITRTDPDGGMFAARSFLVFQPMLLFWLGAWIRRTHKPAVWTLASVLLGFSIIVSLIGVTGPYPPDGFSGYTPVSAARRVFGADHQPRPQLNPQQRALVPGQRIADKLN